MKKYNKKVFFIMVLIIGLIIMGQGKKEAIVSTGCQLVSNFDTCEEIRAAFGGTSTLYALQRTTASCTGTNRIVCVSDVSNQECINSNSAYTNYLTCAGSGVSCTDSDGGATDYQTKGCLTVSGNTLCDECMDNIELLEGTCIAEGMDWNIKDCTDYGSNWGCTDGKCVQSVDCTDGRVCIDSTHYKVCASGQWGEVLECPSSTPKCQDGICVQDSTSNFQVLQKDVSTEGFSIKVVYDIKNIGNDYEEFIVEAQTMFQSDKKTAQIAPPSTCDTNCPYNVYRSVGLAAKESTGPIEIYIPRKGGALPNGNYLVKAISADRCGTGNTHIGPFPDQPIIAENIRITSGTLPPKRLCKNYCGDYFCEEDETYQSCSLDCSSECDNILCEGWTSGDCFFGCLLNERKLTRDCSDTKRCSTSRCAYDESCGEICAPITEGKTLNCTDLGCIGTKICHNSQWGTCVRNDPDCGITCAYLKGKWELNSCPTGTTNITLSVKDISGRPGVDYNCCKSSGGGDGNGPSTDYGKYMPLLFGLIALIAISRMGGSK